MEKDNESISSSDEGIVGKEETLAHMWLALLKACQAPIFN